MIGENKLTEILQGPVQLAMVEPHIYSLDSKTCNEYDTSFGTVYERVACGSLYNRLFWGYRISDYHSFCLKALASSPVGWVLDAACGSLAFTAKTYGNYSERPIVFLDQSASMLKLAKARLVRLYGRVPDNMVFLHGNVLQLPFKDKSFSTVICLNLLHVLKDVKKALLQFRRVIGNRGTVSLTTLVESSRFSDRYLHLLGKSGALVPRNKQDILAVFEELGMPVTSEIKGNMVFINSEHR